MLVQIQPEALSQSVSFTKERGQMSNCIGSGYCCHKNLCFDGVAKHGNMRGPCPSLVWDEEAQRHWCGLVLDGEITGKSLYIGEGCCQSWNTWRLQPLKDRRVEGTLSTEIEVHLTDLGELILRASRDVKEAV